jgi:phosphate transport system protein
MTQHLLHDLERLKKSVLEIGTLVEESLANAITALQKRQRTLAETVIDKDHEVDRREVLIEEECLKMLALHQPVAKDLRFVVAVLKLNNDIERVGDLAVNIAQRAVALASVEPVVVPNDFVLMAKKTQAMFKQSLDALVESDARAATVVCASDDEVDELQIKLFAILEEQIQKMPVHLDQFIQLMSATRHLERIADQATNIAEDVIYMVEGDVVRHHRRLDDQS